MSAPRRPAGLGGSFRSFAVVEARAELCGGGVGCDEGRVALKGGIWKMDSVTGGGEEEKKKSIRTTRARRARWGHRSTNTVRSPTLDETPRGARILGREGVYGKWEGAARGGREGGRRTEIVVREYQSQYPSPKPKSSPPATPKRRNGWPQSHETASGASTSSASCPALELCETSRGMSTAPSRDDARSPRWEARGRASDCGAVWRYGRALCGNEFPASPGSTASRRTPERVQRRRCAGNGGALRNEEEPRRGAGYCEVEDDAALECFLRRTMRLADLDSELDETLIIISTRAVAAKAR
ncbi:hypothetical protein C8J57DRAFT_1223270 [Mycena rebaudengoi]|nr:hypothetical protein C8J57DRAFT_1223270 [Mycena rebaudengoi]